MFEGKLRTMLIVAIIIVIGIVRRRTNVMILISNEIV